MTIVRAAGRFCYGVIVSMLIFWIVSLFVGFAARKSYQRSVVEHAVFDGKFTSLWASYPPATPSKWRIQSLTVTRRAYGIYWPSFRRNNGPLGPGTGVITVSIPFWLPIVVATVFLFFLYSRRSQAIAELKCSCCQYSLCGNVSGICPECGTRSCVLDKKSIERPPMCC